MGCWTAVQRLVLACDAWYGVAHGCTRKLGMKICGKLQCQHHFSLQRAHGVTQGTKVEGTFIQAVVALLTQVWIHYALDREQETVIACFHHTKGQRAVIYPVGYCVNRVLVFCSPLFTLIIISRQRKTDKARNRMRAPNERFMPGFFVGCSTREEKNSL